MLAHILRIKDRKKDQDTDTNDHTVFYPFDKAVEGNFLSGDVHFAVLMVCHDGRSECRVSTRFSAPRVSCHARVVPQVNQACITSVLVNGFAS